MAYKVVVIEAARLDIREYVRYVSREQQSPGQARRWNRALRDEIAKLTHLADKFNLIEEDIVTKRPTRSFQFHSHRVVYQIDAENSRAIVMRVYHGSRQPLRTQDIQDFEL